jgi:uncharacterized hydrophobic protein (TIGR00271 family)
VNDASQPKGTPVGLIHFRDFLRERFDLTADMADDGEIDSRVRSDVVIKGTNLWVLMFATFIASIGLNVNSTAVVIGAMLISPLMGPITGIGYGAGILDLGLVREGLKNLALATLIALVTSTLYFAISPLRGAQSELLARTTPTLWDVLIAIFGGLAGIVGTTRKQKSNVIPGVAIATALMPPLCTAGFGLATGSWRYFIGAFYLFTINCVFIAVAATVVARAFHIKRMRFVDDAAERRVRRIMAGVVIVTVLPSLYLAYLLVGDELFKARATSFVAEQIQYPGTQVAATTVDARRKLIQVSLIGATVQEPTLRELQSRLTGAGLQGATLQIFQTELGRRDAAALPPNALAELYRQTQTDVASKDAEIATLRTELADARSLSEQLRGITGEIHALFPQVVSAAVASAPEWRTGDNSAEPETLIAYVGFDKPLSRNDRMRLESWLRERFKTEHLHLSFEEDRKAPGHR